MKYYIQAAFGKANPLSPEEAKALNWPTTQFNDEYNAIVIRDLAKKFTNPRRN